VLGLVIGWALFTTATLALTFRHAEGVSALGNAGPLIAPALLIIVILMFRNATAGIMLGSGLYALPLAILSSIAALTSSDTPFLVWGVLLMFVCILSLATAWIFYRRQVKLRALISVSGLPLHISTATVIGWHAILAIGVAYLGSRFADNGLELAVAVAVVACLGVGAIDYWLHGRLVLLRLADTLTVLLAGLASLGLVVKDEPTSVIVAYGVVAVAIIGTLQTLGSPSKST
jgi:hypothetical protein